MAKSKNKEIAIKAIVEEDYKTAAEIVIQKLLDSGLTLEQIQERLDKLEKKND